MKLSIAAALVLALAAAGPARAAGADKTYEQLKLLVDVLGYVQDNYVDEPETQKLIYGAASGMVRTLDPYSQFMEPEYHREMKTETEGQFGGVGLRLTIKDDWLTVQTPMPGSPAYRQGVLPNDRIVEIDGAPTKDMTMSDALRTLRGAPGSKVKLKVERGPEEGGEGEWKTIAVEITRELVKIESTLSMKLDGGVGYLRIAEFSAKTADDVSEALRKLKKEGMTSLVVDLRNDPGGLLSAAVEVASMFLGEGKLVVYTQGRKADSRQDFTAAAKALYPTLPLVVLINGGSASASEIVAGAFQDHKRAVVVGQRSFGKASVQSLIPLPDGSGLRLTVARYYTPAGRAIHRDEKNKTGGIEPDIVVPVTQDAESKLYAQWEMVYAKDRKPRSVVKPEEMVRDEALDRAVELLKARDVLGALKREG
ncbi:MAG: S41 family peptidase [Elusimicrobiota bacterium]|nr:MAG: S41 family peptidase [Elusimicrobiota bacterium]